jgi:hypothetical protein
VSSQVSRYVSVDPTLVLIVFGPIWFARVDAQEEQASTAQQAVIGHP